MIRSSPGRTELSFNPSDTFFLLLLIGSTLGLVYLAIVRTLRAW